MFVTKKCNTYIRFTKSVCPSAKRCLEQNRENIESSWPTAQRRAEKTRICITFHPTMPHTHIYIYIYIYISSLLKPLLKKLVRLIKMCLTETYSRVRVGKNLSDMFPIRNGLKEGDALSPLLFNFVWIMLLGGFR